MGTYNPYKEKPEHCYDCMDNNGVICFARGEDEFDISEEYRKRKLHPYCPLVEVKTPHGDLVDRDTLPLTNIYAKDIYELSQYGLAITVVRYEDLEDAPTAIEGESE